MSLLNSILDDAECDLRRVEREMQRQMRQLDQHLQQVREELLPCCPCRPLLPPACLCPRLVPRWALAATLDMERELGSTQRNLNRMQNDSQDHKVLATMDMKGFDPEEVTVRVKDKKVQVLAEHEEAHTTTQGKEYSYKNVVKEITLPPGVSEDEVVYSLGPNSVVKIETAHKRCPCALRP